MKDVLGKLILALTTLVLLLSLLVIGPNAPTFGNGTVETTFTQPSLVGPGDHGGSGGGG